jgi:hypothetical protein
MAHEIKTVISCRNRKHLTACRRTELKQTHDQEKAIGKQFGRRHRFLLHVCVQMCYCCSSTYVAINLIFIHTNPTRKLTFRLYFTKHFLNKNYVCETKRCEHNNNGTCVSGSPSVSFKETVFFSRKRFKYVGRI